MTQIYRFQNAGPAPMIVRIEMWSDEICVPVGSVLELSCVSGINRQPISIERTADGLVFWPECAFYSAVLDGRRINLSTQL